MIELKELTAQFIEHFGALEQFSIEKLTDESCLHYLKLVKGNLEIDYLQRIWQFYRADREDKKQDFTPPSLAALVGRLTHSQNEEWVYDMCAGSGALTIQKWVQNKNAHFVCEELDTSLIPFLLFNLKLRNITGFVVNGDVLTGDRKAVYKLTAGARFSSIEAVQDFLYPVFQTGISNPPFNLRGIIQEPVCLKNLNYAFVFKMLERVQGTAVFILPNGVLDSSDEKVAREYILQQKKIRAVIYNPSDMFEATNIGTVCLVFQNESNDMTFVDARKTCAQEERKQTGEKHTRNRTYTKIFNTYQDTDIDAIIAAIHQKSSVEGFSETVPLERIQEGSFNGYLYIKSKKEEHTARPYKDIVQDLIHVTKRMNACKLCINETWAKQYNLMDLVELAKKGDECTQSINDTIKNILHLDMEIPKQNFISTTKSKLWTFENADKEYVSPILVSVLMQWQIMVQFLNEESSKYLAELRDALLPDLMSGKIQV